MIKNSPFLKGPEEKLLFQQFCLEEEIATLASFIEEMRIFRLSKGT
jgi:hypothetical protein